MTTPPQDQSKPARFNPPGHFRTAPEFGAHWAGFDPLNGLDELVTGREGPLGQTIEAGNLTIGNRLAIHPMEGWDGTADGAPSDLTLRRWVHFGLSGAKLIWGGEAFAVQEDGRANPNQLYFDPSADNRARLTALRNVLLDAHVGAGHEKRGLVVGLQLTHSGRYAKTGAGPARPLRAQENTVLDAKYGLPADLPIISDHALEEVRANFVRAARCAQGSGFDFVDVKCCHGYLLHELLGAHQRPGPYGGSFENRTRLFREIVEGIRAGAPALAIGVRLSIAELPPFVPDPLTRVGQVALPLEIPWRLGFGADALDPMRPDLDEPLRFLELVRSLGIRLVNLTFGSPYTCPHAQRPATYPPSDGYLPPEDPLASVTRQLRLVQRCSQAFPDLVLVGSGYSYLQEWLANVAQYEVRLGRVGLVGLGRMVLSYPQFPADVLAGRPVDRKHLCRTFSDCTTGPRNGFVSGCYPLDPFYKSMPQAIVIRAKSRAAGGATV